jgi:cell division protein ZapD
MLRWMASVMPMAEALNVLLALLRDGGAPQRVVAKAGQFQYSLPQGRTFSLMRVKLDAAHDAVPEISGHRLMTAIRWMRPDAEGRLKPVADDIDFELTLCA